MSAEHLDQSVAPTGPENQERASAPSLFLVAITYNGKDIPPERIEEEMPLLIMPFAFDVRDLSEPPVLRALPMPKTEMEEILNRGLDTIDTGAHEGAPEQKEDLENLPYLRLLALEDADTLEPFIAEQFNVDREKLKFASSLEDILPYLRQEVGYHLLRLSEKNESKNLPERARSAITNTGNMFLMSVGVDRWVPKPERRALRAAYNKHFGPIFGRLPIFGRPKVYKDGMTRLIDAQIKLLMKAKESVKMVTSSDDLTELGERGLYVLTKLGQRGVDVQIITDDKYPIDSTVLSVS